MAVETAKKYNRKIWLDYDDDLFNVPTSNPTFNQYAQTENQKSLTAILKMADYISVTTEPLLNRIAPINNKVSVIPNAWNDRFFPFQNKKFANTKTILWRGGPTHNEDIDDHLSEISEIVESFPNYHWVIMGQPSYRLLNVIPESMKTVVLPTSNYNFYDVLKKLQVDVCLVPLSDNVFNHSKSNIAWMEAAYAGAACIAPDWETWDKPGIINYDVSLWKAFKPEMFENMYNLSVATIQQDFLLSKVNQQRAAVLETLGV